MGMQRALNSSRYIPVPDPLVQKTSEENRIYIFNVGPWSRRRELGSAGIYVIPACPAGREYSDPVIINGLESEPYPINETECAIIPKSGRPGQLRGEGNGMLLAQQVLGEGPMLPPSASFRPFGIFLSKTPIPSKQDLDNARAALQKKRVDLVREANDAWAKDRDKWGTITDLHRTAARDLGKTAVECPWFGETIIPQERKTCPSCGTPYEVGIAECPKCGDVLDADAYRAKMERLEAVKSKPKKN